MTTSDASAPAPTTPDLTDPLYTIEHLARLFFLEVDTVREYTYREDFPEPIKIGRRWLWFPDTVLAWTRKQPRYSVAQRKRTAAPAPAAPHTSYKPRKPRSGAAVAA